MIKNLENKMEKMQESSNKDLEELTSSFPMHRIVTSMTAAIPNRPAKANPRI